MRKIYVPKFIKKLTPLEAYLHGYEQKSEEIRQKRSDYYYKMKKWKKTMLKQ